MEITIHGVGYETIGEIAEIGEKWPAFTLKDANNNEVKSIDLYRPLTLISVVPDIDTRVCSLSTRKFNGDVDNFSDVAFYTISTNSAEQQQRWCAAENVKKMKLLSDEDRSFGRMTGLLVPETGNDARSVWVLDENGIILYREFIVEQSQEPNYEAVLNFLKENTK